VRVKRLLAQIVDHDMRDLAAERADHLLQQVMRQRAGHLDALHLQRDGFRFERTDPDWQVAVHALLFQHDEPILRDEADLYTVNRNLDHDEASERLAVPSSDGILSDYTISGEAG